MIQMWDGVFSNMICKDITSIDGALAFELMHQELDKVWNESFRVLKEGGIACINIGDATRTINNTFQLYSNHSRILNSCIRMGFSVLPSIIWRKPTNSPNKFMGSGMLPVGAYVTLEHEHIIIMRKGKKREFKTHDDKLNRQQSSFFWEERNSWFSDLWNFKGTNQKLLHNDSRKRSGAFPLELAYRLINMFSVKSDTILDPFVGTGTTLYASIASGRNSIGIEIDTNFNDFITKKLLNITADLNNQITRRLKNHIVFTNEYNNNKSGLKYINPTYNFQVMTKSEREIVIHYVKNIVFLDSTLITIEYYDNEETKKIYTESYIQ